MILIPTFKLIKLWKLEHEGALEFQCHAGGIDHGWIWIEEWFVFILGINPHLAWKNIWLLTGSETAHHKTNTNMAKRIDNGDLAFNAKDNMSIFNMHFRKLLNNHRPVDSPVLDLIEKTPHLTTINTPITFRKCKHAINKLKMGRHLASTWFLQTPPKQCMTHHYG